MSTELDWAWFFCLAPIIALYAMMKIGLQAWSSNDDVCPLPALAASLQQAVHQVTLVMGGIGNQNNPHMSRQLHIGRLNYPQSRAIIQAGYAAVANHDRAPCTTYAAARSACPSSVALYMDEQLF